MYGTKFISLRDVQTVLKWIEAYVCKSHPDLGRAGPICPFVKPSLDKGKLLVSFSYDIDGGDIGKIEHRTYEHMNEFLKLPLSSEQDRLNTALITVFPNIRQETSKVIDSVHTRVKTEFVRNGLMLGQFHQTCSEPAARNRDFEISRSPFPIFAIRYMALHDILFLNQKTVWFDEYHLRFGTKYELGQVSNREGFVDMFNETKERLSELHPNECSLK